MLIACFTTEYTWAHAHICRGNIYKYADRCTVSFDDIRGFGGDLPSANIRQVSLVCPQELRVKIAVQPISCFTRYCLELENCFAQQFLEDSRHGHTADIQRKCNLSRFDYGFLVMSQAMPFKYMHALSFKILFLIVGLGHRRVFFRLAMPWPWFI